jgi:hypothetical protein
VKLLNEGVVVKPTCNNVNTTYKLAVDEHCPSVLALGETAGKGGAKGLELIPVNKMLMIIFFFLIYLI